MILNLKQNKTNLNFRALKLRNLDMFIILIIVHQKC